MGIDRRVRKPFIEWGCFSGFGILKVWRDGEGFTWTVGLFLSSTDRRGDPRDAFLLDINR